jgi:hypothetical protein
MDIGHATAQDYGIGIDEIGHGGKRTGKTIGIAAKCGDCPRLSATRCRDDLLARCL